MMVFESINKLPSNTPQFDVDASVLTSFANSVNKTVHDIYNVQTIA